MRRVPGGGRRLDQRDAPGWRGDSMYLQPVLCATPAASKICLAYRPAKWHDRGTGLNQGLRANVALFQRWG